MILILLFFVSLQAFGMEELEESSNPSVLWPFAGHAQSLEDNPQPSLEYRVGGAEGFFYSTTPEQQAKAQSLLRTIAGEPQTFAIYRHGVVNTLLYRGTPEDRERVCTLLLALVQRQGTGAQDIVEAAGLCTYYHGTHSQKETWSTLLLSLMDGPNLLTKRQLEDVRVLVQRHGAPKQRLRVFYDIVTVPGFFGLPPVAKNPALWDFLLRHADDWGTVPGEDVCIMMRAVAGAEPSQWVATIQKRLWLYKNPPKGGTF